MIAAAEHIKWLHVEASSRCNAWCPACDRNNQGFGLRDNVTLQDLLPERFEAVAMQIPTLHGIQFCGNLGDPIASEHIVELVTIAKKYAKKIQIHTNGSLRNEQWWKDFAATLSDIEHDVWFGIDGLSGVHEIYRQGTDFNKIIKNAQAFIEQGGHATWQFIPYQHNEHQIKDCMKMSSRLKFKKFYLAKLHRHQTEARHWQTGEAFDLLPPQSVTKLIKLGIHRATVKEDACMHLSMPSVYLAASGAVSRCCYYSNVEQFDSVKDLLSQYAMNLDDKLCIIRCG